jgi:hypothetical protein
MRNKRGKKMAQTSKKLYKKFASEIKDLPSSEYPRQVKVSMACLCARIFAEDNDLFSWSRFYDACGINDAEREADQAGDEMPQDDWEAVTEGR